MSGRDLDTEVKLEIYRTIAETARVPTVAEIAAEVDLDEETTAAAFDRLTADRLLVLEAGTRRILMAPPFSGVPTQHVAVVDGRRYFANCAWDVLGVVAALGRPGSIESRCEQSGKPFRLAVASDEPEPSDWLFHSLVPAARWWDDIGFT